MFSWTGMNEMSWRRSPSVGGIIGFNCKKSIFQCTFSSSTMAFLKCTSLLRLFSWHKVIEQRLPLFAFFGTGLSITFLNFSDASLRVVAVIHHNDWIGNLWLVTHLWPLPITFFADIKNIKKLYNITRLLQSLV